MRELIVPVCVTAIVITFSVLGYVEYVRRDSMERTKISELEQIVAANEVELRAAQRLVAQRLMMVEMLQKNGAIQIDKSDRQGVADELTDAMRCFRKLENNRRMLAEARGEQVTSLSEQEVEAFRDAIFDANPGLEKVVKR